MIIILTIVVLLLSVGAGILIIRAHRMQGTERKGAAFTRHRAQQTYYDALVGRSWRHRS